MAEKSWVRRSLGTDLRIWSISCSKSMFSSRSASSSTRCRSVFRLKPCEWSERGVKGMPVLRDRETLHDMKGRPCKCIHAD